MPDILFCYLVVKISYAGFLIIRKILTSFKCFVDNNSMLIEL